MKTKLFSIVIVLPLVFTACKNAPEARLLKEQVISLHDSIMAKNDHVVHLEMKIDSLLKNMKNLSRQDSSLDTTLFKERLSSLQGKLKSAEEKMNDWMYKFEPDASSKTEEAAKDYFFEQKKTLVDLKHIYDSYISESDSYLSKMKK